MKKDIVFIYIISEDPVFTTSLEVMFKYYRSSVLIKKFSSLQEISDTVITIHPDLIILDEIVSGAAIFETISFLRQTKRVTSSIIYFGEDVHDIQTKALRRGANHFYKKPFNPRTVVYEIVNNWVSISQNEFKSRV